MDQTSAHPSAEHLARAFLIRYSGETLKTRSAAIRKYLAWCAGQGLHPLDATRVDVECYSMWLREDQHLRASTTANYLSAVSVFYRVAVADGWITADPTIMVRRPKVHYDPARLGGLSTHDLEKLMLAADKKSPGHVALLLLMGVCAFRASEAANVRIEDFAGYERGHRVLHLVGKGSKPATVPLPPLVARVLERAAGDRTEGPLLTTRTGKQLNRHDVKRWVDSIACAAGLAHIHPHELRRSAVTIALDAGADHRDVQNLGRWADPRMVWHYDQNRQSLDRHAAYTVAARMSTVAARLAA